MAMFFPSTHTLPLVAVSIPPRMFRTVVLPAPLGPTITANSPLEMLKLISSTAMIFTSFVPYILDTFAIYHAPVSDFSDVLNKHLIIFSIALPYFLFNPKKCEISLLTMRNLLVYERKSGFPLFLSFSMRTSYYLNSSTFYHFTDLCHSRTFLFIFYKTAHTYVYSFNLFTYKPVQLFQDPFILFRF